MFPWLFDGRQVVKLTQENFPFPRIQRSFTQLVCTAFRCKLQSEKLQGEGLTKCQGEGIVRPLSDRCTQVDSKLVCLPEVHQSRLQNLILHNFLDCQDWWMKIHTLSATYTSYLILILANGIFPRWSLHE